MRAAITSDTRVSPVEENQKAMSGQMDELYAIAAEGRQQVTCREMNEFRRSMTMTCRRTWP